MRIVAQRVASAAVDVGGERIASIGAGLLLLVGCAQDDDAATAQRMAQKCADLRIFPDEAGRFSLSLLDVGGEALVVSQFTLLADTRRGRRPSFTAAAPAEVAEPLVEAFAQALEAERVKTQRGRFGAHMHVALVNDGPVTIMLDSDELERPRRG